jgi:hypothetical protein
MSIVAPAVVRSYLNDGNTDATYVAFLQTLIDRAEALIFKVCNYNFGTGRFECHVWPGNDSRFVLVDYPSQTPVALHKVNLSDGTDTDVGIVNTIAFFADSNYRLVRWINGGIFEQGFEWRFAYTTALTEIATGYGGNVKSGLGFNDMLVQIVVEMVAIMLRESGWGDSTLGFSSELNNLDQRTQVAFESLEPRFRNRLKPFKRIAV